VVGAKLRQVRRLTAHESGFLKQHARAIKITMPGVMTRAMAWYKPGLTDRFYPGRADLVRIWSAYCSGKYRRCLTSVSYIQLDSLHYVIRLADPHCQRQVIQAGGDQTKNSTRLLPPTTPLSRVSSAPV
jgi:hypothetical protein